ncbi:MAG: DUF2156 domain-containing protein [Lachnospiraceae bacterium]|nr:DUF2156 domain-containing protein [Lachnospiraceae bacterium]
MELVWKDITLEDKETFEQFYKYKTSRGCELSFSNNYLWVAHYGTKWSVVEECLVFYNPHRDSVSIPIGKNPYKALDVLMNYYEENHKTFALHLVTKEQFEDLEAHYPGKFTIEYVRDVADYIYEAESLGTLAGKKLHAKRNHINRFVENYPEWTYEEITDENLEECFAMARKWREQNKCDEDKEKSAEICVTLNALKMRKEIGLTGGLIRTREGVVAFSLGAPLTEDTFVVHIEKAFADIQGAYPIINREFVLHAAKGYRYINREEDLGEEGLRKAKMSYNPAILLEKGNVRLV